MVANCEQMLTTRYSRRLIVMEAGGWGRQRGTGATAAAPACDASSWAPRRMPSLVTAAHFCLQEVGGGGGGQLYRADTTGPALFAAPPRRMWCAGGAAVQKVKAYDAAEAAAYFERKGPPK